MFNFIPSEMPGYEQTHTKMIPFNIGDILVPMKESQDWFYGCHYNGQTTANIYGIYPKSYMHEKDISGERNCKVMYGENRFSIEGKSILYQSRLEIDRAIKVKKIPLKSAIQSIDLTVELIKVRENLVDNKYSGSDFTDELKSFYKKLSTLAS